MRRSFEARVVISIAIAALLGITTTVAVALAFARLSAVSLIQQFRVTRKLDPARGEPEGSLFLVHVAMPGRVSWMVQVPALELNVQGLPLTNSPESLVWGSAREAVLPWLSGSLPWPQKPQFVTVYATGWPFPALFARQWYETGPPRWDHVLDRTDDPPSGTAPPNFIPGIPTGVLWDRFAIDTAAFASLWWLLLYAPKTIRFLHRKRKGLCLTCGYDLRATPPNTPCPECGTLAHQSSAHS